MMAMLLLYPFFAEGPPRRFVMNVMMSVIFVFAVAAVSDRKKHLVFGTQCKRR